MNWLKALFLGVSMVCASQIMAQQSNYSYSQQNNNYSAQINWLNNYEQAVAQSKATSKPILILFTGTTWCPACIKLEKDVLNHPEFVQAIGSRFVFLKAEFGDASMGGTQASPFKPLLDRYQINAFPTMLVINPNGQPLYSVPYQTGGAQAYVQKFMQNAKSQSMQNQNNRYMN